MTYQIKSNNSLSTVIVFFHFASLLVLIPLQFPFWVYLIISMLLLSSVSLALHRTGAINLPWACFGTHACSVSQLIWDSNDLWRLRTHDCTEFELELLPGSAVYSWVAILNFKTLGVDSAPRKFSLLLTEKHLPLHEFRRLRVRLGLQSELAPKDSL